MAIPVGMMWYLIVVLIYIFLMTNGIKHFLNVYWPLVYLLWLNVNPVIIFHLGLFLLLNCKSPLYILDISSLSYAICKYVFPILYFCLQMSLKIILIKSSLSIIFVVAHAFMSYLTIHYLI